MNISTQPTVYLVDASIYIFRAWFSVPDSMRGESGQPVNAVYGFCRFLTELVERTNGAHIAISFDESLTKSFRNEIYPPYKMNRGKVFVMQLLVVIKTWLNCCRVMIIGGTLRETVD